MNMKMMLVMSEAVKAKAATMKMKTTVIWTLKKKRSGDCSSLDSVLRFNDIPWFLCTAIIEESCFQV